MKALEGYTVLDFTRILAGPFCTMNLADLGAEVIKVESLNGDDTRTWGPPFAGSESAYYLCANRNKRSIALDLKSPDAKGVVTSLIERADIVIHNFKPSSLTAFGLDYSQVSRLNPRVIYCGISGYGAEDGRPGYDYIIQAVSGLMSITGPADGQPQKVGVAVVDLFTGLYAAVGILAALHQREVTGAGQALDMALYDSSLSMLANIASNVLIGNQKQKRLGNAHPNIVPYQLFPTSDGEIVITVGNDKQYKDFCRVFELEELARDNRFKTNPLRVKNRDVLCPLLEERLSQFTTDEISQRLTRAGVPFGAVNSVEEAMNAAETSKRNMVWETTDEIGNVLKFVGSPLKMSNSNPGLLLRPPRLGEHTAEILAELGMSNEEIEDLKTRGVIQSC